MRWSPICPELSRQIIHYPVADPFGNTLEAYRQARDAIHRFVAEDLPQHLAGFEGQPGSQVSKTPYPKQGRFRRHLGIFLPGLGRGAANLYNAPRTRWDADPAAGASLGKAPRKAAFSQGQQVLIRG
jgi:hypothetical protein